MHRCGGGVVGGEDFFNSLGEVKLEEDRDVGGYEAQRLAGEGAA